MDQKRGNHKNSECGDSKSDSAMENLFKLLENEHFSPSQRVFSNATF